MLLDANWVAKIADFGDVREAALHPAASASTGAPSSTKRPSGAALNYNSSATSGGDDGSSGGGSARYSGGRTRHSSGFRPSSLSGNNGATSLTRRRNGGAGAEGSALMEGGGRGSSWMGGWRDSFPEVTTVASAGTAAGESTDEGRFAANSALLVSRLSEGESDVSAAEVKCGMFGFGSPSERKMSTSGQQPHQPPSRSPPPAPAPTPAPARPLEANMRFGTVGWASPELVVGNQEPSFASDAFAMGTLLWELATFKQPFLLVARREEGLRGRSLSRSLSRGSSFASTQDGFLDRSGHGLPSSSMTSSSILPPDPSLVRGSRDSESRLGHSSGSGGGGLGFHAFGAAEATNRGSRVSESEGGLTGGWADLLRDDLARSYHGSTAHSAAAGAGGGAAGGGGGQQDVNDADGFNSRQQRVGRAERDRRAAIMRGGSAVLSRAGEIATSWSSSHHRRQQQQMMMQQPQPTLSRRNTSGNPGANTDRASLGGESFVSSLSSASVATDSKAAALLEAQR